MRKEVSLCFVPKPSENVEARLQCAVYKKIFNNVHVSVNKNKLDNKYYAYVEESDSYYGFKSLIICLLDGKIIENRGYSYIEYKRILRKILELDILELDIK